MLITPDYFSAFTCDTLKPTDVELPLDSPAKADLLSMLKNEDDYMYLTIRGDIHMETVKVHKEAGYLIMERGIEGTQPARHHSGSCVSSVSPTIVATVKDLICNWSCCNDEPCPCTGAELEGIVVLSSGQVGFEYKAVLSFGGSLPMNVSISGLPRWATAVQTNNTVVVTGVPDTAGETKCSVSVTNCGGSVLRQYDYVVRVSE